MVNAVLVQGANSKYDDQPGEFYHFPSRYLRRIRESLGDWVVFFSPVKDAGVSKEHRGAYYAVAQLGDISADPIHDDRHYVSIVDGTYLNFSKPVSRTFSNEFIEPGMNGKNGKANVGFALQAVRHISTTAFERILSLAWPEEVSELPRIDNADERMSGVSDLISPFVYDFERDIVPTLTNRKLRDRRFRLAVLSAYQKTCAITGWQFINGGGRAEVEAAHIKAVEQKGPDSIDNGLALSGTVHWMFDRGLIGIADNDEIIISRKVNNSEEVRRIINPTGRLIRPTRPEHQPHTLFLRWHREYHDLAA